MEEENPDIVPDLEKVFAELGVGKEGIGVVWDKMKTVTENLNGHMPKIEELRGQIKTLEEEVAGLRQKDQEIKEFCQEVCLNSPFVCVITSNKTGTGWCKIKTNGTMED